jgi:hypothetical protein
VNYMLLIIGNQEAQPLPQGGEGLMEQFIAYHRSVLDAGVMVESNVLEAQVALTLRYLGGLSTTEVARAFLVSEATMQQRLVRAKQKIRVARVPFRVPERQELAGRLAAVLHTLYVIFTEGYAASTGTELVRADPCEEAVRLARILHRLLPGQAEVAGLLALLLLVDARRPARADASGDLVPLEDQDRALWDAERIAEGRELVVVALKGLSPGPYSVQAALLSAEEHERHRRVLLLIDEAHLLSPEQLEEVRLLSNSELDPASPFAGVLLGQPTLASRLRQGIFAALDQRISVRYSLGGMDLAESVAYLRHHLALAGRADPLIADDAAARLHRYANGLPRALNNAATAALMAAAAEGKGLVDDTCAKKAVAELTRT